LKTTEKSELKESPFVKYLFIRATHITWACSLKMLSTAWWSYIQNLSSCSCLTIARDTLANDMVHSVPYKCPKTMEEHNQSWEIRP
jgi:hypothetical protein